MCHNSGRWGPLLRVQNGGTGNRCIHRLKEDDMEARELAEKLNGRTYGDSFDDVLEEAKQSGLVIVTGASKK